jgi:hypothetical protein
MEIITKQRGLTLVCLQCGCRKRILPMEVPVGDCEFCFKEFGWTVFPKYLQDRYHPEEPCLFDGDEIVVDMKQPLGSEDRICEIRKNGLVWYSKGMK